MQRTFRHILIAIGLQLVLGQGFGLAQCLNGGTAGPNLIVNGNFSAGNVSFTSDYTYCNAANCLQVEGRYAVGTNANFFHTGFTGVDHTTGTGNFMIVNGSINAGFKVWQQTVGVTPNTDYQFDFWVLSCVASSPAQLIVRINGVQIHAGTLNAPPTTNNWIQYQLPWNSGAAGSANIEIINQNLLPSGNDFGLDDLALYTCQTCNLTVQSIPDTVICQSGSVQLSTFAPSATGFSWSPGVGLNNPNIANPVASPSSTISYTVTVTDGSGCVGMDTVLVQVVPPPSVNNPGNQTICVGGSTQLTTNYGGTPSLSWSPGSSLSCNNCPNPIASPTSNTIYTYTATNSIGCQTVGTVTVNIAQAPAIDAGSDITLCNSQNGQLNASYTDTAALQGIQWQPPLGLSPPTVLNPFAHPQSTTIYTLAVTNVHGCTGIDSVTVYKSNVTVDAGPDIQICGGGSVQLQGTTTGGIGNINWAPSGGLSQPDILNPTLTLSGTVTVTLTVTDTAGCTASDQVTVSAYGQPTIAVTPDTNLCEGSSVTLAASGVGNYQWSPASGLSCTNCPNPTVSTSQTQTYTVIATDVNGCKDTAETTVTIRPNPTVTASATDTICVGESTNLTANGTGSFAWDPTGTLSCANCPNPTATPTLTTTYQVVATNQFGCKDTASTTIHVSSGPPLSVSPDDSICPGEQVSLQVSGTATSYAWSPAPGLSCTNCSSPTASPTSSTIYTVVGNSAQGCGSADTVRISVHTPVQALVTGDTVICSGGTKNWQASGLQSYQWIPSTGLSCSNCPNTQVAPASTTTYTLSGLDQNGCAAVPVVRTMHIRTLPNIQISGPDTICQGGTGQLAGFGGNSYTWSPSLGLSCINCPTPTVLLNQTRTYQVIGTDVFGCQNTDTLRIVAVPAPSVSVSPDGSICPGESYPLSASGGASYQWQGIDLSCTNCASPVATPNQTTTYTVTITATAGCQTVDTVRVTVNPSPAISVSNDVGICLGESAWLSVSSAANYQWSPDSSLSCSNCTTPTATPTSSTTYTVTATSGANCPAMDSIRVDVYPLPQPVGTPDTSVCRDESIQLQATGGSQYSWSPASTLDDPLLANPVASPSAATTYTVEVTNSNGCKATGTVTVLINDPLSPNAYLDTTVCPGEQVQLFAQNGQSYQWAPSTDLDDPLTSSPIASPSQNMVYYLSMVDINGCLSTDSVRIALFASPTADAGTDLEIYEGQSVTLGGSGGTNYLWRPGDGMNDSTSSSPSLTLRNTTVFTLFVTDQNGCAGSDQVTVSVLPVPNIYLPSAFTPNGDGQNDLFVIPYGNDLEITRFVVYDRWGVPVFFTQDPLKGWDGTSGGEVQPVGTYVYILEGFYSDGTALFKRGNVTLIR